MGGWQWRGAGAAGAQGGAGAACAGRGAALLVCAPGRSPPPPPRLESANSAVFPARRRRPGPRVSKPSFGEGAGWRAPAQPARGQGRCWRGRFFFIPCLHARPGAFDFRAWEGRGCFLPPLLLYGIVGLMGKAADEPTLLIGFDGTGKQQPVYRFWTHHTFLKLQGLLRGWSRDVCFRKAQARGERWIRN